MSSWFITSAISLDVTAAFLVHHAANITSRARILLIFVAFASTLIFAALIAELVAACAPARTKLAASQLDLVSWISNLRHVVAALGNFDHSQAPPASPPALPRGLFKCLLERWVVRTLSSVSSSLASDTRHLPADWASSVVSRDVCRLDEAGAGRHRAICPVLGSEFL